ncbi:hypothetical protein CDL12_20975 [Handroanthus impetiginosus]|uniref:Uncharacterized protein n=1 Tax=Handroanthus impetiginosus TaxID=429701 RepID=A0A2G9GMG7_9LAMI|nr:hypothetical protein CDL12_20975 [Handroanthus impetiginosus]
MNNASDVNGAASNKNFPEIMPLREGENRFVSTRGTPLERKLANSQHEHSLSNNGNAADSTLDTSIDRSLDHILASGSSTVSGRADLGITPQQNVGTEFSRPADTFSRRDQTSEIDNGTEVSVEAHESRSLNEKEQDEKIQNSPVAKIHPQKLSVKHFPKQRSPMTQRMKWLVRMISQQYKTQPMSSALRSSPVGSTAQSSITSHPMNSNTSVDPRPASGGPSSQMLRDENVQSGWAGKSLERSAVKEPGPLIMSEEARAEWWFKHAAQTKDISELSQIPDEDFPSIMPVRKGVNRFVVSKRKTPLERRSTSQQHKRNLPIVTNDSVKKENDNS